MRKCVSFLKTDTVLRVPSVTAIPPWENLTRLLLPPSYHLLDVCRWLSIWPPNSSD